MPIGDERRVRVELDSPELESAKASLSRSRFRLLDSVLTFFSTTRWWVEVLLLGSLYALYSAIRNNVGDVTAIAFRNGHDILSVENFLHINLERPLNQWVHHTPVVANVVALEYATLHFIVTPAVLIWLMVRRTEHYRLYSGGLIITTLFALIGFFVYPAAPPRMLSTEGFYDIMSQTSSWGWWPASGAPGSDAISNQYAAMPSLHCAWATWCGLTLFFLARRTWVRVLGLLYPITTYFTVMATGNHYFLDVVAGLAVLAAGTGIALGIRQLWNSHLERRRLGHTV
ncbi:phosphatase PAP2 family protein [Williamsia sp. CHRR-6]|nr:phosphatase PAP2 family protein [Williamsia sp. CHRR-6]